jgi:uncharacterized protein (TIGR02266 family)
MSAERVIIEKGPPNRRHEARLSVNREFASAEEFLAEYVANVSRSGAFIRTDDPLPVGTKVALRFTVILDELETIEGIGMVVRRVPLGGGVTAGMGVVFIELTAYSKQLIEKIMTRR